MPLIYELTNLNKQLNRIKIENIKKNKNKNIIKDKKVGSMVIREQILKDFPPKELRSVVYKEINRFFAFRYQLPSKFLILLKIFLLFHYLMKTSHLFLLQRL